MASAKWTSILAFVLVSSSVVMAENTWPNRLLYELDSQLYDREGYNARNLPVAMRPDCSFFFFGDSPGRSNAADWIRTAYHDMATHNSAEGSGGLDASIRFETGRPENAGTGFNNTLIFIRPLANRYFSLSDDIALAAVTAIEMCGGPKIPFRGGRVDATEANIAGVPEPQQSLDEHIANFARQGFSHEEMISLTACGHTFGGIQHSAFPDIAPPSSDSRNTDGNAPFDTTFAHFDNKIATDYLDGTTANPLVIGHNVTTRSDLRIFSSDGNETMSKFTNPAVFKETCTNLFSRMINAVPNSVTLTDVIEPIKFKPVAVQLVWIGDGNLRLQGEVRVWDSTPSEIRLKWKTKNGDTASQSAILVHNPDHTTKPLIPDSPSLTSQWFDFPPILINATESVSKFWFEVKNSDGSVTVEDLDGTGYPIQDAVLITKNSCVSFATGTTKFIVNFAVSANLKPAKVTPKVIVDDFDASGRPITTTHEVTSPATLVAIGGPGYNIYSTTVTTTQQFTLAVELDSGERFETPYIADATSAGIDPVTVFC